MVRQWFQGILLPLAPDDTMFGRLTFDGNHHFITWRVYSARFTP